MARTTIPTFYQRWMDAQGIPVHRGYAVADVRSIERRPWDRLGVPAAFIDLFGMEGFSGMHVVEVPPGGATTVQRHMYQQLICGLEGHGTTEIWADPGGKPSAMFEWGQFSMFSPPLNSAYRIYNVGNEPLLYLAVNDAPMVMDLYHNLQFVFENDFRFVDRYTSGEEDYFTRERRFEEGAGVVWETNFIDNVASALVDNQELKGSGVKITIFDMAENSFAGHLTEFPVGKYHLAHHHQGGAILLMLRSDGYSIMWPIEAGPRPYENGFEDQVVRVDWGPFGVLSPPTKWFHQHFNAGHETARQLAFRPGGSSKNPTGFRRSGGRIVDGIPGVYVSYRKGGTLIEAEDEDPRIKRDFVALLDRRGIAYEQATREESVGSG